MSAVRVAPPRASSVLQLNAGADMTGMLKDGYKSYSGVEEAIMRNAEACKDLAAITQTSLGPNGMHKLVINHLDKLFITTDAATIVSELEVMHPAAKMVVMASKMQEQEFGDGTNLVVTLAGELLSQAEYLLRMGVHPCDIIEGYKRSLALVVQVLPQLCVYEIKDLRSAKDLSKCISSTLCSKQYGNEEPLSRYISEGCISIFPAAPKRPSVNVDRVRVCKLLGRSVADSQVMKGMVLSRDTNGIIKHAKSAKVAVFACAIESGSTETKGTVVIKSAGDLMNYNKSEEKMMEEIVQTIAASGVKVVVSGGSISEMAQHFLDKYDLLSIKLPSKFDMRRICETVNATALARLGAPTAEEMGFVDLVDVKDIGGRKVTVFEQQSEESQISTLVLRGSTNNILDDLERAVDDGVNAVKALTKDCRLLPGAGATEIALAMKVKALGDGCPGLEQYAIKKFAEALEIVPRILAENSGQNAPDVLSALYKEHVLGHGTFGVNIEEGGVVDVCKLAQPVYDIYSTKESVFKLALDAVLTILKVDQLIMSKPAGGPKPPQ